MSDYTALTEVLNQDFSLHIVRSISFEELKLKLAQRIHFLINNEFQELIQMLYRIDVDETRLKKMLAQTNEDAGMLIATLIIERQLQKIESGKKYRTSDDNSVEEKW